MKNRISGQVSYFNTIISSLDSLEKECTDKLICSWLSDYLRTSYYSPEFQIYTHYKSDPKNIKFCIYTRNSGYKKRCIGVSDDKCSFSGISVKTFKKFIRTKEYYKNQLPRQFKY